VTPTLMGIAGGTSSGKTSFAAAIVNRVGEARSLLISMDAYYHDPSHLALEERTRVNYDHPDAYDVDLLVEHLDQLRRGEPVPRLAYDYVRHARVRTDERLEPRPLVILEGILALENARLRERFDIKLFIDTDADVRILRRLGRDVLERGRTLESVTKQYLESVRPMHLEFTEPSKRFADLIVPEGARNQVALDLVAARVEELLSS
jgi:uridine kinase